MDCVQQPNNGARVFLSNRLFWQTQSEPFFRNYACTQHTYHVSWPAGSSASSLGCQSTPISSPLGANRTDCETVQLWHRSNDTDTSTHHPCSFGRFRSSYSLFKIP